MRGLGAKVLAPLLAVGVLIAVTAVASADTRQPVKTGISLRSLSASGASGKISTKQKGCRVDRKVRLVVEPQGGGGERPGGPAARIPVAGTKTARDGSWQISAPLQAGRTYFAEVDFRVVGRFGCRFAQTDDQLLALPPATGG